MRFFCKRSDSFRKETRIMLELLQCECIVFTENVKIEEVQERYRRASEQGLREGFIPLFIVPSMELLDTHRKRRGKKAVLKNKIEELLIEQEHCERLGQELIMAKIPGKQPWEVVSCLPHGWWASHNEQRDFILRSRKWYELYGAMPAVFAYEKVDFVEKR